MDTRIKSFFIIVYFIYIYILWKLWNFFYLSLLFKWNSMHKKGAYLQSTVHPSPRMQFIFYFIRCVVRETKFRLDLSSHQLIQRLLSRLRFIFHRSKGYWFVSFLIQMDSLLYDFDSSLFHVEEEKGLLFFFFFFARNLFYDWNFKNVL